MTKVEVYRLLRRLSFPLVLAGCLFFLTSSSPPQSAVASACCDDCDSSFNSCRENCYDSLPAGAQRDSCLASCRNVNFNCLSHCEMCQPGDGQLERVREFPKPPPSGYRICFTTYYCNMEEVCNSMGCFYTLTCTPGITRCYN